MGTARRNSWIDYSFMQIGGLHNDSVEVMRELCRRFGSERAMSVYSTAIDWGRNHIPADDGLALELINESGVDPTPDDLEFLAAFVRAVAHIECARKLLEVAIHGKS